MIFKRWFTVVSVILDFWDHSLKVPGEISEGVLKVKFDLWDRYRAFIDVIELSASFLAVGPVRVKEFDSLVMLVCNLIQDRR